MSAHLPRIAAIIVAAGSGTRAGGDVPKQYQPIAGQPVLRHTIWHFVAHPAISSVRVVIHPDNEALYLQATEGLALADPVHGGSTRQDSVRLGLEALRGADQPDYVLVHDAARPFVTETIISAVINAMQEHDVAIAACPVTDTIKQVDALHITDTLDRSRLWAAQTPQGFVFQTLYDLHQRLDGSEFGDDAALAESMGLTVAIVPSSPYNTKLTTAEDMTMASLRLSGSMAPRTGMGFDVHRLIKDEARPLMLCGVEVPSMLALEGHSDADVGLHALTDAVLGCIADGDIGMHFSPKDERWKDCDSSHFLQEACRMASEKGGQIQHVDVTLIGEQPKIGPYREAMRIRVAELCALPINAVSIKATTTERLGFTGRGEGLAAQAVASMLLPV